MLRRDKARAPARPLLRGGVCGLGDLLRKRPGSRPHHFARALPAPSRSFLARHRGRSAGLLSATAVCKSFSRFYALRYASRSLESLAGARYSRNSRRGRPRCARSTTSRLLRLCYASLHAAKPLHSLKRLPKACLTQALGAFFNATALYHRQQRKARGRALGHFSALAPRPLSGLISPSAHRYRPPPFL